MTDRRRGPREGPWKPADATDRIRALAAGNFMLILTKHAQEQMRARDLSTGDIAHVLKTGFVYEDAETSTKEGLYKYKVDGRSPSHESRVVRVVAIPSTKPTAVKIVTVMWKDG